MGRGLSAFRGVWPPGSCSTRLTNTAALRSALLRRAASPPIERPRSQPKEERTSVFRVPGRAPILYRPHRRLALSRGVRIAYEAAFADCRSIAPIAHFDEQAFVTYAGQIAARSAKVGQVFRPDYLDPRASATARSQSDGFEAPASRIRSVAITLTSLDGGFSRSMEGNRQRKVRSFVQPGEPIVSITPNRQCCSDLRARRPRRPSGSRQRPDNVERKLH